MINVELSENDWNTALEIIWQYRNSPAALRIHNAIEDQVKPDELCEHGMAAWLCMGPMHFPSAEQEMRGEYF